jgi:hypothetical protein
MMAAILTLRPSGPLVAASQVMLGPNSGYSSLLVNSDGHLESFGEAQGGGIYHSWQGAWGAWYSLGNGVMQTAPVAGLNADGRGEAFAIGGNGVLYHTWQPSWLAWVPLAGQGGLSFVGRPAVSRNADGRLEVFARSTAGSYWHAWQIPAAGWSGWSSLGGGFSSDPTVIQNSDGREEVVGVITSGAPYHAWQVVPNGAWSDWSALGGVLRSDVSAVRNLDGRLEFFGVASDRSVYHTWQVAAGGFWTPWAPLGGSTPGNPSAVVNPGGSVEVFVRGADGQTYHALQQPDLSWSAWTSLGGFATSDPIAVVEPNQVLSLWVAQYDHWYESDRTSAWSGWQDRGAPPASSTRTLNVPWYHQQYVLSCEEAALRMGLAYHAIGVDDGAVLGVIGIDRTHYWAGPGGGDPFRSFVGDPNGSEVTNTGYGTYFPTISGAANQFQMSPMTSGRIPPAAAYAWVLEGHPVLAWVTFDWQTPGRRDYTAYDGASVPYAGPDEHTVTIAGITPTQVFVNDPDRGQYWVSRAQFEGAYGVYGDMGVVL